jgi:hypothetical protein
LVRVSRAWIKNHVSELKNMDLEDIDKIKIWPEGWQTTLTGAQKKAIEKKEWRGSFDVIFSAIEKPVRATVRRT